MKTVFHQLHFSFDILDVGNNEPSKCNFKVLPWFVYLLNFQQLLLNTHKVLLNAQSKDHKSHLIHVFNEYTDSEPKLLDLRIMCSISFLLILLVNKAEV